MTFNALLVEYQAMQTAHKSVKQMTRFASFKFLLFYQKDWKMNNLNNCSDHSKSGRSFGFGLIVSLVFFDYFKERL